MGHATPHLFAIANLRHSPGDALQQPVRRSSRRRGESNSADVAAIFGHAMGRIGGTLVRETSHLIGDLDVAALSRIPGYAPGHEGRSRSAFSARDQSTGGPRLAVLAGERRRSGMAD